MSFHFLQEAVQSKCCDFCSSEVLCLFPATTFSQSIQTLVHPSPILCNLPASFTCKVMIKNVLSLTSWLIERTLIPRLSAVTNHFGTCDFLSSSLCFSSSCLFESFRMLRVTKDRERNKNVRPKEEREEVCVMYAAWLEDEKSDNNSLIRFSSEEEEEEEEEERALMVKENKRTNRKRRRREGKREKERKRK